MHSSAAILTLLAATLSELPSGPFNLPVQHRTRTCVEMKGDVVALRFADGTPTGFWPMPTIRASRGAPNLVVWARWKSMRTKRSKPPTT